ncbi:MAG TPA: hypothetical protein PLC89_14665 [Haliscomenobacter sp.]|uniref:hypothetical protein n=1 Tax=Haliscomenobacter sp. TaxID=2717303 RepID=UPI002C4CA9BC|nr:hypothetical protein [Haliscomenobacter sp.]HOY18545.1 hypothetical protein [Haliscomenobacter sp.]
MKQFLPFMVMILILGIVSMTIVNLLNYHLKKRIIDAGPLDETAVKLLEKLSAAHVLKWAIVFFTGGLGLVVIELLPFSATESLIPYGLEAIFLAMGFLIYYLTLKNNRL